MPLTQYVRARRAKIIDKAGVIALPAEYFAIIDLERVHTEDTKLLKFMSYKLHTEED